MTNLEKIKKLTDSLMARELQLYRLFSIVPVALTLASVDGYFKMVNHKFCELLEYSEKELLSKQFIDFVHEDDVEKTMLETARLAEGLVTVNFVNRYRTKSGNYININWNCVADADGSIFATIEVIK